MGSPALAEEAPAVQTSVVPKLHVVDDMGMAAYLMLHGVELAHVRRGRRWEFSMRHVHPDPVVGELIVRDLIQRYPQSDISAFRSRIDDIKRVKREVSENFPKPGAMPDGRYQVGDLGLASWIMGNGIELDESLMCRPAWAIRFRNPTPDDPKAGLARIEKLRYRFPNTRYADYDGKVRSIKKAAYGD